jgi:hypothetical protein
MSTEQGDEVTAQVVDALWLEAIGGLATREGIHERAEELLERVNAESPVVNRGMTDLHALTRLPNRPLAELIEGRSDWLAKVAEYNKDPQGWMRRYFVNMVDDFSTRKGVEAARAFAGKLVKQGVIRADDFPAELRP